MPQRHVPTVSPMRRVDIDRQGDHFLRQHYPRLLDEPGELPVDHLIDILLPQFFDINSGVEALPRGTEGICEPPNVLTIDESVYAQLDYDPRARFTAAHEAWHGIFHLRQLNARFESGGGVRLYRRATLPAYLDPEWQANRGAASILMPARMVWEIIGQHGSEPEVLQTAFGVSHTAATYRLDDARHGRLWRPSAA